MTDLLIALDWNVRVSNGIRLITTVTITILLTLVLGLTMTSIVGVPIVVWQGAVWGLWLTWLGAVFPRNRRRDEATPCSYPYRRAFGREILYGIAVAFSQLLQPAVSGVLVGEREFNLAPSLAIGLSLLVVGVGIVCLGVLALGVARTLFVHEYVPMDSPVTTAGIFQVLRHPLFLGGSIASLGLAVCTGTKVAIGLAILNGCVVPIYVQLEDRRCCATLGSAYVDYRAAVGGVIPRRRSAISRSALASNASGNIDPTLPRDLATTR